MASVAPLRTRRRKRREWKVNPSVFLLSDDAARKHTEVLAKRAEEICLIQCSRLLIRTTRLNSFFLSPFGLGGAFHPSYLAGFPLVSLK